MLFAFHGAIPLKKIEDNICYFQKNSSKSYYRDRNSYRFI